MAQNSLNSFVISGHAVTIIIVVCVGFLVFMVVLGVIRVRAAHTRHTHEDVADAEMAWDDSSLNITVNPMEQQLELAETQRLREEDDDDDDSSDDGNNYSDELDSSDEEEGKPKELDSISSTLQIHSHSSDRWTEDSVTNVCRSVVSFVQGPS
ncbi:hypothetical protein SK128_015389 [Halocaridina rubra]|uniref:Calsyntenin C-terminal domain-containing protein n=1 Tax=Halocaridina rubra TaxID=373956 RepID=A0AAN8WMK3_HALRR